MRNRIRQFNIAELYSLNILTKAGENYWNRVIRKENCLQWAKMENVEIDAEDNPVFLKTYNKMMEETKKVTDSRFRFGTSSEVSLVAQALAFGDRRLFPVLEECAVNPEIKYFGGMGFGGKKAVPEFTKMMRDKTTLTWSFFAREKDDDEIFPWEHISTGVDKSWLLKYYNMAKDTSSRDLNEEGDLHVPCYKQCSVCGVCRSFERKLDNFWPEEVYGKGRKLPKFEWPDREEDDIDITSALEDYLKPRKLRVIRLMADINPKFRYVDSSKMKYRLRRACFRAGIPIRNDISAASDLILEKSWFSGKELYELYIADKRFSMSEKDIVEILNKEFSDEAMSITRAEWYTGEVTSLRQNFEYVLYSLTLNRDDFSISNVREEVNRFKESAAYTVKVKRKSKTQRDVVRVEEINAKDFAYKVFIRDNNDETYTLFAALSGDLAIYDFATAILKTSKRKVYKYPAIVEEYLLKSDEGSLDMLSGWCTCGEQVELNIWGEDVADTCVECFYKENFKHRDNVKVDSGFTAEEDLEVEDIDLGGHDDDDIDDEDKFDKNNAL